jgi:VWFA-related protein
MDIQRTSLAFLLAVLVMLVSGSRLLAQELERPQLKDFGSSLKRNKSEEKKNDLPEGKSKPIAKPDNEDIEVLKVETSLVTSDVLVLDAKGNPVQGLTEKDFVITEDGRPQQLSMLAVGDDLKVARSIVLIIDYSGSQLPFINTSIAAAKDLVDKLAPADSMAIVTDDVDLIQNFTRDKQQLKTKLDELLSRASRTTGKSKQYSALLATLNEVFSHEDQRPIVIFQTDGDEIRILRDTPLPIEVPKSRIPDARLAKLIEERTLDFSLADICRAAEKARATIYTVLPGDRLLGRSPDEQIELIRLYLKRNFSFERKPPEQQIELIREYLKQNFASGAVSVDMRERLEKGITNQRLKDFLSDMKRQAALTSVSLSTGGWTSFLIDPSQADRIYSNILADINQRYIVGYYPTNKEHDGKRRRFDVTVRNHPDYVVLGRRWYYAPAADQ